MIEAIRIGLQLTFFGMTLVFAMLTALWGLMTALLWLDRRYARPEPEAEAARVADADELSPALVAAITLALRRHREVATRQPSVDGRGEEIEQQSRSWVAAGRAQQRQRWPGRRR